MNPDVALNISEYNHSLIPFFSLRDPSPLTLRPTGLHWPMRLTDLRYPVERKHIFSQIVAPFTAYAALQHSDHPFLLHLMTFSLSQYAFNAELPTCPLPLHPLPLLFIRTAGSFMRISFFLLYMNVGYVPFITVERSSTDLQNASYKCLQNLCFLNCS